MIERIIRLPKPIRVAHHNGDHDASAIWNLIVATHRAFSTELTDNALVICSCGYAKAVAKSEPYNTVIKHYKSVQAAQWQRVNGYANPARRAADRVGLAQVRETLDAPSHDAQCELDANRSELMKLGDASDASDAEAGFEYARGLGLIDILGNVVCKCAQRKEQP